jgi:RNA polymerase sigma-70 factor, ECF subfamily
MAHVEDYFEADAVVDRHRRHMLAAARRVLRDEEDASDAVQDAFLAACRSWPGFRAEAQVSTWLYRIAINAALMRRRRAHRRRELPIGDSLSWLDWDGQGAHAVDRRPPRPDDLFEREELRRTVRAGIDALPSAHRRVIMLRDIEERSTGEVADLLGISPNAVKIRVHRARSALRALLQGGGDDRGGEPNSTPWLSALRPSSGGNGGVSGLRAER